MEKKYNGAVFKIAANTPAYKIIAKLEKTDRKPAENTLPFASKTSAVTCIANLFPNYAPVFSFPILLDLINYGWFEHLRNTYLRNARFRETFRVLKVTFKFILCRI